MFGYIFPDKPELKVKEYELFKAYYCGLCKSIGSQCGQLERFILNYDSSFLGLFLSSFKSSPEVIEFEGCIVNPLKKKPVVKESDALNYAADMNVILAYYKLKDDYEDDRSKKALALMGVFHSAFKNASRRNPQKAEVIQKWLKTLSEIESRGTSSIDEASEPFAKLTEEIFLYEPLCTSQDVEKILRWFGYNIGKWIYLIDAYDDIEKDIEHKNFNPILNEFCYNNEKVEEFKERIVGNINFTLTYTLSQVGKAFELLDIVKNKEILRNIIYGGMYNKTLQIIGKRSCGRNERSLRGAGPKARSV